jgi:hypothetical protein
MASRCRPTSSGGIAGRFPGRRDVTTGNSGATSTRTIDQALAGAGGDDPLPIVLAGVNSSTSLFVEVSRNASSSTASARV